MVQDSKSKWNLNTDNPGGEAQIEQKKKKNHKQSLGIGNKYFLIGGNLVHFRGWGLFGRNGVKSAISLYYF